LLRANPSGWAVLTVMQMAKRNEVDEVKIPLVELARDIPWFTVDGQRYEPGSKGHKYSGALKAPVVQQTIPEVLDDVLVDIFLQRYQKLELLREQFRIPHGEEQWFWLAFRLACRHVPGLRVKRVPPRKVGRPPTIRDPLKAAEARKLIEDLIKKGRGIAWAVQRAHRERPDLFPSRHRQRYYDKPRLRKKPVR
jgi:hypothetical protein